MADQILAALKAAGKQGITRTEISHLFARNKSAERITRALTLLREFGRIRRELEETTGRAAERWYAK